MKFEFYGYLVRTTTQSDASLAEDFTHRGDPLFWLKQEDGRESFLVSHRGDLVGFFQAEHIPKRRGQARLHFQHFPTCSVKVILRGLLKLVPLIEKALALRGVRAVFFTSRSPSMSQFMSDNLGYTRTVIDGGLDGVVMTKILAKPKVSGGAN